MQLTTWVLVMACVTLLTAPLLGGLDLTAYLDAGDAATLSRISQQVAWKYPLYMYCVCFLLGELPGHLFTTRPCEPWLPRLVSLVLFVAVPYLIACGTMIAALRAPGGLPPVGSKFEIELAPVLVALLLGATSGAYNLHQTGP